MVVNGPKLRTKVKLNTERGRGTLRRGSPFDNTKSFFLFNYSFVIYADICVYPEYLEQYRTVKRLNGVGRSVALTKRVNETVK